MRIFQCLWRIPTFVLNFPLVVARLDTFVFNIPLVVARLQCMPQLKTRYSRYNHSIRLKQSGFIFQRIRNATERNQCSESACCRFVHPITWYVSDQMISFWFKAMHLKFLDEQQIICCWIFEKISSSPWLALLCAQVETICRGFNSWLSEYI